MKDRLAGVESHDRRAIDTMRSRIEWLQEMMETAVHGLASVGAPSYTIAVYAEALQQCRVHTGAADSLDKIFLAADCAVALEKDLCKMLFSVIGK